MTILEVLTIHMITVSYLGTGDIHQCSKDSLLNPTWNTHMRDFGEEYEHVENA